MGEEWKQLGMQTAGGVVSAGMGMLLGNYNDRRQRMQQDKLWQMELKNRKEMTDYQMEKEYEMWLKTNYDAQKNQMKEAELNPALMYGMGGGAGGQLGSASGNVSGATAPGGGREVIESVGMGMNLQMQRAQMKLLEAQAENIKADTANKPAEGAVLGGQLDKMAQETDNLRYAADILRVDKAIKELERYILEGTKEAEIAKAGVELSTAVQQFRSAMAQANVDIATQGDKINIMAQEAIAGALKNELTKQQTELAKKGIQVSDAQIKKMAEDIAQGWRQIDINDKNAVTQAWKAAMDAGNPGLFNVIGGQLNRTIEAIWNAFGKEMPQYKTK